MVPIHKLWIVSTELDILKHETATGALRPSLGTFQHPGRKFQYLYKSYNGKDTEQSGYATSQTQQAWCQLSDRGRGRGHGHWGSISLRSPSLHAVASSINDNYCFPGPHVQ